MGKKFPHFSLKIPAGFGLFLLLFLVFLNLFGETLFLPTWERKEKKLQKMILRQPFESKLHQDLANYYLLVNSQEAEKEYLLAEKLYQAKNFSSNQNVLGATFSPFTTWQNFLKEKEKTKNEIVYWQKVKNHLPSYQYASVKLAALFLEIGEKEKAKNYLQEVLDEFPLNSLALRLRQKL